MSYLHGFTDAKEVNYMMASISGELAFDVGANGGFVAKLLCRQFGQVVACEPAIESYQRLVPRCPVPNLTTLNIAVSDHNGTVNLGVKKKTETTGQLYTGDSLDDWEEDIGRRDVDCRTLNSLAEEYGIPDFVKIDTEGHECQIVEGGSKVWESQPRFCIEIHSIDNGDWTRDYFDNKGIGYAVIRHQSYPKGSLDNSRHYWMVRR